MPSDVDREESPAMSEVDGDASGAEMEAPSCSKARGMCGQFVWPCPREYHSSLECRRAKKCLIPEDLTKEEFGLLFKDCFKRHNQLANVARLHVFDEPHQKYNKKTGRRARHKHCVFKCNSTFAHTRICQSLKAKGVHGHFSFNLVGYQAYLQYCLTPSSHKLGADIDRQPWSWPSNVTTEQLLVICNKSLPQMDARNNVPGRKRRLMTFSEVTDAFVEGAVRSPRDAWTLAKSRKISGDDTLWNTLGAQDVPSLVGKVLSAWNCEDMSTGTWLEKADFGLKAFMPLAEIDEQLVLWLEGGYKEKVLILFGEGGHGKTELACAMMSRVTGSHGFHFINQIDRVRDIMFQAGQGLVLDEAGLSDRSIDDCKALVDVKKGRDIKCRNKDGVLPKQLPRILSTNWPWDLFWPKEAQLVQHATAVNRRVFWVHVAKDIRLLTTQPTSPVASGSCAFVEAESEDEDIFGHMAQPL